jgi:hypothetical protein
MLVAKFLRSFEVWRLMSESARIASPFLRDEMIAV